MALGGGGQTSTIARDPGAALQAGKLSSLRARMGRAGRGAMLALSMMQASPTFGGRQDEAPRRDPVAELQASRHQAQKFANPGRIAPNLLAMNSSLNEDTDDGESDDDFSAQQAQDDDAMQQIADEAQSAEQGDGLSSLARMKSQVKARTNDALEKMAEKMAEEAEERMRAVVTDVAADTATGVDQGEMLLIPNTIGTGAKATRVGLSVFGDSLSPTVKQGMSKMGIPVMSMTKITDVFAYVGFLMQAADWTAIAAFVLPFVVILLLSYATCATQLDCSAKLGAQMLGI